MDAARLRARFVDVDVHSREAQVGVPLLRAVRKFLEDWEGILDLAASAGVENDDLIAAAIDEGVELCLGRHLGG